MNREKPRNTIPKVVMSDTSTKPWYSEEEKLIESFDEKLSVVFDLCQSSSLALAEIPAMEDMQKVRMIYESNLIEGAGVSSEGATKKLIDEYFPKIPNDPVKTKIPNNILGHAILSSKILDFYQMSLRNDPSLETQAGLRVSVQFAGKSKEIREVLCHRLAISAMVRCVIKNMTNETKTLFSEEDIKKIHRELADGLLSDACTVQAGDYRNDMNYVDNAPRFPAPELVPTCMKKWVEDSNALVENMLLKKIHPIRAAAKISYDFVLIHPFPDFNGRMSRLIMNMVLTGAGLPFLIDLRGNGKNKKRYFTALQHANRGKIASLSALLALRGNEILDETLENLRKAGCNVAVPSSS